MFLEIDRIISTRFCVRKIEAVLSAVMSGVGPCSNGFTILILFFFSVIRNPSGLDDPTHYMYGELYNSPRRFV